MHGQQNVKTFYLVKHHYFICPQTLVASHWFLTIYITPTHWLVPTLRIGQTASSLQLTRHQCAYFCMMNTCTMRNVINSNESTSKCHFHIAKQFTNA